MIMNLWNKKKKVIINYLIKKLDEIQELSKEIDYKNLNYIFTTKASGPMTF